MLLDNEQERQLQTRYDALRNCAACRTGGPDNPHKTICKQMLALTKRMKTAPASEQAALLSQYNALREESAAFIRADNERFCREHPEKCLP